MKLIASDGGPFICIEAASVHNWQGIFGSSQSDCRVNDYDRACAVSGYLGVIKCGEKYALVLGDMPIDTSIWTKNCDTYIIRIRYSDMDVDIPQVINSSICNNDFDELCECVSFKISESPLIVLDSSYAGSDRQYDSLIIDINHGYYKVIAKEFKPNKK